MVKPSATSTTGDDALDQVREFIAQHCSIPPQVIRGDSTLVAELGISGADGVELMLDFSRKFDVDISCMNVGEHFGDEGLSLAFWRWSRPLVPLTVSELAAAARAKRWPAVTSTI